LATSQTEKKRPRKSKLSAFERVVTFPDPVKEQVRIEAMTTDGSTNLQVC